MVDYSDYCDSSFLGVRYRAVLSEDRLGRQVKIDQEKL